MYYYEIIRMRSVSHDTDARTLISGHHCDPVPGINTPRLDTVCCQGAETLTGLVSSINSLTTISG